MTKKLLGLMFMALLCASVASALTYVDTCTPGGFVSPPGGGSGSAAGTASCVASFTVPAGDTLSAVDLFLTNSFSQAGGTGTTVTFTYTLGGADTGLPSSITGVATGFGSSGNYAYTWTGGSCVAGMGQFGVDNTAVDCTSTTDSNPPGTVTVSGTETLTGAALLPSGTLGWSVGVTYTYNSTGTPEPASLLLVGGGLIGLAFAGRRKFRA
jgi:hypothetical protein